MILQAGEQYFSDPSGAQIPDWTRALAVEPELREQLRQAVDQDASDARAAMAALPDLMSSLQFNPSSS